MSPNILLRALLLTTPLVVLAGCAPVDDLGLAESPSVRGGACERIDCAPDAICCDGCDGAGYCIEASSCPPIRCPAPDAGAPIGCDLTDCGPGHVCCEGCDGAATCVAAGACPVLRCAAPAVEPVTTTCDAVRCPSGTVCCEDCDGGAVCRAGTACPAIRCPAPDPATCGELACGRGEQCCADCDRNPFCAVECPPMQCLPADSEERS